MKKLIPILLLATLGCGVPKKAPQHVRTERQGKYFLDSLKSINRTAKLTDSIQNLKTKP